MANEHIAVGHMAKKLWHRAQLDLEGDEIQMLLDALAAAYNMRQMARVPNNQPLVELQHKIQGQHDAPRYTTQPINRT